MGILRIYKVWRRLMNHCEETDGMTLLEVIAASAISGILAVGLVFVVLNTTRIYQEAQYRYGVLTASADVYTQLSGLSQLAQSVQLAPGSGRNGVQFQLVKYASLAQLDPATETRLESVYKSLIPLNSPLFQELNPTGNTSPYYLNVAFLQVNPNAPASLVLYGTPIQGGGWSNTLPPDGVVLYDGPADLSSSNFQVPLPLPSGGQPAGSLHYSDPIRGVTTSAPFLVTVIPTLVGGGIPGSVGSNQISYEFLCNQAVQGL